MGAEEPSIPVLVERLANLQEDVSDIKRNMATRSDQAHVDDRIRDITALIASERAERFAGDEKEAAERKRSVEAVATRLQVVEDRMEQRKYLTMSAVAVGALGAVLGLVSTLVQAGLLGR